MSSLLPTTTSREAPSYLQRLISFGPSYEQIKKAYCVFGVCSISLTAASGSVKYLCSITSLRAAGGIRDLFLPYPCDTTKEKIADVVLLIGLTGDLFWITAPPIYYLGRTCFLKWIQTPPPSI